MNLVERFRGHIVNQTLTGTIFSASWPQRLVFLTKKLPTNPTPRNIVELGNNLASAQIGPSNPGRSQSAVSVSGHAWQSLIVVYLNMIYAGTPAIAVSPRYAPNSLKQAMRVSYAGPTIGGDLDAALIVLPAGTSTKEPEQTTIRGSREAAQSAYWSLFNDQFHKCYVSLIACKTNWNDSVQTPMLWNLLYSLRQKNGVMPSGIAIGDGGRSLDQLSGFNMSFVTVPTGKLENFKPMSMPVQRSRAFTGGYYWGHPASRGVVDNISAFPDRQASISQGLAPSSDTCGSAFSKAINQGNEDIDFKSFRWNG